MFKRKRDTVEEESADPKVSQQVKKQRTSTSTPQAKAASVAAPTYNEHEESVEIFQDRESRKRARTLAKRERKALRKKKLNELGPEDGTKTQGNDDADRSGGKQRIKSLEKRRKENRRESREAEQEGGQKFIKKGQSKKEGRKVRIKQSDTKKGGNQLVKTADWKLSDPLGGQMLDVDPVFSPDEKFLLVVYGTFIAVYSISTSLLVRRLQSHRADSISAFAFSSRTQGHLYLSTISGIIEKWDWTEGIRLGRWKTSSSIYSLVSAKQSPSDPDSDLVYTVDKKGQEPWLLSVHRLAGIEDDAKTDVKTLFKNQDPLTSVKIIGKGRVIVATSGSQVILGTSDEPASTLLKEVWYRWRIIECPEYIVSTDLRVGEPAETQKMSKGGKSTVYSIDIVVGGLKGSIHIYEDLLRKLIKKNRHVEVTSRRLHWHRNAVQAVKWSADGNYIISGGQETTLVLWQLETEQRQHLPHLGAAIESIVVSPFGSSYAIRLADNSAMILSTTELRPTFSIAGIQLPAIQQQRLPLPFVPTATAATKKYADLRSSIPACASIFSPGHLLLAVPPTTTSKQSSMTPPKASYLQTFDIGSAHQISRQALTRTKVTTLNMGPELNIVEEPNVTLIHTSSDGQWLASVDEWMPPKKDVEPLTFNQARVLEELVVREEIYLKFWSWNVQSKMWELISRMDNPHAHPSGNPYDQGRVLDLVSDPSSVAFATVGEDGVVKMWRPAVRRRNGLEVKGKDGRSLRTWHCQHAVPLETSELVTGKGSLGAKIAYSQDGSILAAGVQSSVASPIYIIDTYSGEIKSIHTGQYAGPLIGLGIVYKYLVTLSDELRVYDLVDERLQYGISLPNHGLSPEKRFAWSHLAVNAHDSLFAIAVPQTKNTKPESQVAIFDPADAIPQFLATLPNIVTTLVSASGRKGFYAIDSAAQVRSITLGQAIPSVPMTLPEDLAAPGSGLNDLFGVGRRMRTEGGESQDAGLAVAELGNVIEEAQLGNEGPAVVSQDKLAEVFEVGPGHALPPVMELFEQVAMLYCGKVEG